MNQVLCICSWTTQCLISFLDESTAASGLERLFDSLTTSSPLLHTLELIVEDEELIDTTAKDGLFTRRFPHLRVLTLNEFTIESPEVASEFWSSHPYLERVEISDVLDAGSWFNGLTHGNLPKLTILKVRNLFPLSFLSAKTSRPRSPTFERYSPFLGTSSST